MYSIIKQKGFTLIELLVVIAIIGVLATVVLSSLNSARMKARDAQRLSDLRQIKTALMLYYDDHGHYPYYSFVCSNSVSCQGEAAWSLLAADLAPYIKTLPVDPINTGDAAWDMGSYAYNYISVLNEDDYDLMACLEDHNSKLRNQVMDYTHHYSGGKWLVEALASIYLYSDH